MPLYFNSFFFIGMQKTWIYGVKIPNQNIGNTADLIEKCKSPIDTN